MKSLMRIAICFLLCALAFAFFSAAPLLSVKAQAATKNTFSICVISPSPIGVNQEVLVICGVTHQTAWPQPGWKGITVTVERPDGKTETLGPVMTDTTGMTGINYKPTLVGTYYFQSHFPEQICEVAVAGTAAGTVMKASSSDKVALVVTQEARPYYPSFGLPTEYWTRPIDAEFREWSPVAGNWLNIMTYARYAPYNDYAPETPHLLWQKVLDEGGLVGGLVGGGIGREQSELDIISYEHGDAYEGKWINPVVINGILYYNRYPPQTIESRLASITNTTVQEVVAVDLHTGEQLWAKTLGSNERLAFGQVMYWKTMNMYGAFAYLWTVVGTTWNAYDPTTGSWIYRITGVPSGTRVRGSMGEILVYGVSLTGGWMMLWNSTRAVHQTYVDVYKADPLVANLTDYYAGRWRPWGLNVNGTKGIQWNVTIPKGLPGAVKFVLKDRILGSNTNWLGGAQQPNPVFWAISLKPGEEGRLLFNASWTLPQVDLHVDIPGSGPVSLEDGVFVVGAKETRQYYGFDINTGRQLWGPTESEPYLNAFTNLYMAPWGQSYIAYGKLYTAGMAGVVNCYDVKTGKRLWTYTIADPYTETLWSNWPAPIGFITDGKVYLFHQEHSANTPVPRGAPAVCLNAETGEEIWRINGLRLGTRWGGQPIIADSTILGFSSYDNTIVAIGKGPTATTVTAPEVGVSLGSSVVIRGTVMDVSPGTKDPRITLRFPDGVPAVDDANMDDWMLYVYKQFPRPTDVKGVWVKIDAINVYTGEYIDVGGTTTDSAGFYTIMWTPPKEGLWTILATFPGSKAYYPSFAETSIGVTAAPPPPETPEIPTPPDYTPILTGLAVAVVIAIIIGIVNLFAIRKRH